MKLNAVGGGPFVVSSYVEGEHVNLERNVNYYRKDEANNDAPLPYVDGRDTAIVTDRVARRTAFISKQAYEYGAENIDEATELENQYDVYSVRGPVLTFVSLTMNVTKPPWDDARIRKAAMYAMNRQEYIDIVYKGDAKANGLVQWPLGVYALSDEELAGLQPYDPDLSKQLIKEATGKDTLKIKVMYPANSTIEEHDQHLPIFLKQMEDAGFEIEHDAQEFTTWLNNYTEKNYELSFSLNQNYETPEFVLDWQHSKGPAGSEVYGTGLQDPEVDAALERAKTLTDQDAIVEEYHKLQRMIYEKGPAFLPLVSPYSRSLYWNFVKGVPQGLALAGDYVNTLWLDQGA
jgi:peptide/nickel transport system substrate-binding protein